VKTLLRVAGSALLVGVLAWRLDWRQLGEAFSALDVRLWAAALATFVLAQFVSSLRWQMLAAPLDFDVPYHRYASLYFIGMFFNLVLPTSVGGDVVRAWYLGAGSGRRFAAFCSVLADRASGVVVLTALACAASLALPVALPPWMTAILAGLAAGLAVGLPALLIGHRFLDRSYRGDRFRPLVELLGHLLRDGKLLWATTLLSLLVQLASVAQVWLVSAGLGLKVPFGYLAVVVPLVSLLTLVPVSLNGMGLREVGLVVLLAPVGVTAAQAVSLSLLYFALSLTISLAGGGFYLAGSYPRFHESPEERADDEPFGGHPDQGREGQPAKAA
jgi:uncharacterized membrane protein YbhN (UPF0104 family)